MVLPMLFLAACTAEDFNTPSQPQDEGVVLNVNIAGSSSVDLSRATSERTDRNRIDDMNIVLADAAGKITKIIYLSQGTEGVTVNTGGDESTPTNVEENPEKNEDALMSGSFSFPNNGGKDFKYHLGTESMKGVSQIFIVCNYWQIKRNNDNKEDVGSIIPESGNLNNCLKSDATITDLKALQQGTPFKPGIMTSTLFGEAKASGSKDTHGGQIYTCELVRTTAMITVAITSGSDNEKLKDGVKITPRSISLHNVPVNCNIGSPNVVETDERIWEEGLVQQVGWDSLTSVNHGTTVGGHGADENIVPLFMFENLQGTGKETINQVTKEPLAGKEKYCSYIEVTADYLYTPQIAGDNQKYISGPIKYRLYLGEDIFNDFNVKRNTHYQVTLSLKGMGGLVEDGRTYPDGSYKGDGEGASWRVVSDGVSGGGSFLSDGLNMASNGFLSYVGFVGEEGHNYAIYCEEGVDGAPWLWAQTPAGIITPSEGFPAIIYSAEECGGEPGVSYIMLYAQPWIDEYGSWEQWSQGDISTTTNWINNGYRVAHLILKDKTTGQEVSRFEARQWLPMPVMVNDNGDPIASDNPNDASFYYSRIDVYEGREIPWGPGTFNDWDANNLITNRWTYYKGYWGSMRTYNKDYGFDVMVALYGTNQNAFDFNGDHGRPEDALGTAIFRAGNAVTSSGGSIEYKFEDLARIGLPTVKEWEKIMQYGKVDVRFGISNVPYWTSTMSGTQSYTYNPITGVQVLENRDAKHRTRLVYHKNDFAHKN